MRIGIFTDTYPPQVNGVATSIVMLEGALRKLGHQVFIITVNNDNMSYKVENNGRTIRIPGIPTGIYDYRLTGIYPIRAIKSIKKFNLDVIHSHTEFGIGTFARIIAKQLDIPLIHTYHTMYEDYTSYITHGHFDAQAKKIVEYFTNFYCDKTAGELIVPTKKTYDLFKNKYKFDRNVHIVPTGIDIEKFYKEKQNKNKIMELKNKYNISDNDFVILFVGRLGNEKNISFLIENQEYFVKKYGNVKLLIVGDGPDADSFKKEASKLGDNVIFTGKILYPDIPAHYQLGSVFVTASKTETQGLTIIEAMAGSLPVVCVNDDSFNNVVVNDLNGYLFNNKKEYRKYIEKLILDKSFYEYLCGQARISTKPYSSKYYASRCVDVYREALKNKKHKKGFLDKIRNVVKDGLSK